MWLMICEQGFARVLEELRAGTTHEWVAAIAALDDTTRRMIVETKTLVKVTHYGYVNISMMWPSKRHGNIEWVDTSTSVLELMVLMIMQFVEICT